MVREFVGEKVIRDRLFFFFPLPSFSTSSTFSLLSHAEKRQRMECAIEPVSRIQSRPFSPSMDAGSQLSHLLINAVACRAIKETVGYTYRTIKYGGVT